MSKTFQPDSLHPYIMDARLKKATGSGGISNIPIASSDTLGGIKVPTDSGITIDGSGNAYAYKPINYSTDEEDTLLLWVDGNKIYRKVIDIGTLPNNTTKQVAHGINYDKIISISGSAYNDTYSMPIPYVDIVPTASIKVIMDSTNLTIQTGSDRHDYSANVTITYTKPTTP